MRAVLFDSLVSCARARSPQQISALPTLILFKNGVPVDRIVRLRPPWLLPLYACACGLHHAGRCPLNHRPSRPLPSQEGMLTKPDLIVRLRYFLN